MFAVSGDLKISIQTPYGYILHDIVKDFIESRSAEHNSIRFNFEEMRIQSIDSSEHYEYLTYTIYIPFNADVPNLFSSPENVRSDIEESLTNIFENIVPDNFEGISGLTILDECGWQVARCSYDDDGYKDLCMEEYKLEPISENKLSTEKVSTARKLFILQDEGD